MRLEHQTVLLTGASGGIGRELALQLAARGARLALAGRNADRLASVQQAIDESGGHCITVVADLTEAEGRKTLVRKTRSALGEIDILINNAGALDIGLYHRQKPEAIEQLLRTNLFTPMLLTREVLPWMLARESGRIVNIGSTFGSIGFGGFSAYSASKFALRGFSEALRRELADTRIGVTYVAPRGTRTGLNPDALYQVSKKLGFHFDAPEKVARRIVKAIIRESKDVYIGFPEKLFARINGIFPRRVDAGTRKQMSHLKQFLATLPLD